MQRLNIPNYPVGDAARYARIGPHTVRSWQREGGSRPPVVAARDKREPLSYLQLIEVAVVAAFRRSGLSLKTIREVRDYVSREMGSSHPFAEHEFAKSGRELLVKFRWDQEPVSRKWLNPKQGGQLAWHDMISGSIQSFEYERDLAIRWHVGGKGSEVIIDPRIAFGAPSVEGLPTRLFKERWLAGEPLADTADDFNVNVALVRNALQFEGIDPDATQPVPWLH